MYIGAVFFKNYLIKIQIVEAFKATFLFLQITGEISAKTGRLERKTEASAEITGCIGSAIITTCLLTPYRVGKYQCTQGRNTHKHSLAQKRSPPVQLESPDAPRPARIV